MAIDGIKLSSVAVPGTVLDVALSGGATKANYYYLDSTGKMTLGVNTDTQTTATFAGWCAAQSTPITGATLVATTDNSDLTFEDASTDALKDKVNVYLTNADGEIDQAVGYIYNVGDAQFKITTIGTSGTMKGSSAGVVFDTADPQITVTSGDLVVAAQAETGFDTTLSGSTSITFGALYEGSEITLPSTATVTPALSTAQAIKVESTGAISNVTLSNLTSVAYTGLTLNDAVKINEQSFTLASTGALKLWVNGSDLYIDGSVASQASIKMQTGVDYYTSNGNKTLVSTASTTGSNATVTAAAGGAIVKGLAAGETATVTVENGSTYEYSAVSNGSNGLLVTQVVDGDTENPTYWKIASTAVASAEYDYNGLTETTSIAKVTAGAINLLTADAGSYNQLGISYTPSSGETAAAVVTGTGSNKSITVNKQILKGVVLTGATSSVTDTANSKTVYTLDSTGKTITANGSFGTNSEGALTSATGTITVTNGALSVAASSPSGLTVDLTNTLATEATFTGSLSNAVTVKGKRNNNGTDFSMTITEGTNTNATTVTREGDITGLDGGAVIKMPVAAMTAGTAATFGTASAGSFSFNGQTYTVTDDDNVTFTVADESNGARVSEIAGLAKDAKVATTSNISGSITVNGTAFTNLTAKNGATFTGVTTNTAASITLYAKGDTVSDDATTGFAYVVTSMGSSADDGVTVDFADKDVLSGLNNGDTVEVYVVSGGKLADDPTVTYTVNNNILNVTTAAGKTTSYTLDEGESAFTVTNANNTATPVVSGGTAGETVTSDFSFGTTGADKNVTSIVNGMYINSNNEVSTSSDKAVAQVTVSDDTATYTALSAKAQVVKVAGDTTNKDNWVITTLGGKDTITYAASTDATIDAGGGDDTVSVDGNGDKTIVLGEGKDSITATGSGDMTISAGAGNDTIRATGTGDMVINLDSGNNLITRGTAGTKGNATIVGGTGKDTITARNSDDVVSGGDGADTFDVATTSMTISDYVYDTDVLEVLTSTTAAPDIATTNFGGDGVITISGSGTTAITADVSAGTGTGEFYAVNVVNGAGKEKQNVAWAKDGGSTIDVQSYEKAVTMIGNADGANALYAGKKNDTIYSYADNDSVYGGEGKDSISMAANGSGRVVGVGTASGKDSVAGFTASFEDGDSIYMVDGSASEVSASFASNTVTFKDGNGSLQLNNITAKSTGAVELNVQGTKMALTGTNGIIATDSTSYADFYVGDNAAVSFAAAEGEVNVDLRNGLDSGAEGAKFSGITAVTGGAGNNTLIGGTAAESIYAGTGASSLWGGAGKDSLIGSTASDAFFIGMGDGSDVVLNFSAAGNENADTLYTLSDITSAKLTNNGVEVSVSDTDKLTLKNVTADTAIKFNSNGNAGVAKVGSATNANNFNYDSTVTYYGGGSKSDKIAFASGSTENAQIWLDGSQGKAYASIDVVDGTNTSGNLIVAGDSSSQSLIGGKGDTSLWGGAGSATDTLKSSSTGNTMFWWGTGEGNDVVVSASANDSVNLYNLRLSDVDVANSSITNSGVSLALNDGSKLTVQTSRDMNFTIDGQSWTAQHNSKTWKQNS